MQIMWSTFGANNNSYGLEDSYESCFCAGGTTYDDSITDAPPTDSICAVSDTPASVTTSEEGAYPPDVAYTNLPTSTDSFLPHASDLNSWVIGSPQQVTLLTNDNLRVQGTLCSMSNWLWFQDWGYSIPVDATIKKVVFAFQSNASSPYVSLGNIAIRKGGQIVWVGANTSYMDSTENKANQNTWPVQVTFPSTPIDIYNLYCCLNMASSRLGYINNLHDTDFELTWTAADINSNDWGFGISVCAVTEWVDNEASPLTAMAIVLSAKVAVYYQ